MIHNNVEDKCDARESEFNCSFLDSFPNQVKGLISWKSPVLSGSVIMAGITLLVMMKTMSFISVIAYVGLFVIASSMILRVYCNFINTEYTHPLHELFDKDAKHYLTIMSEIVRQEIETEESCTNKTLDYLRSIAMLDNYADAFKFLLINIVMVYVGMLFNMLDLVILFLLGVMIGPKVYSIYRVQIDDAASRARVFLCETKQRASLKLEGIPGMLKSVAGNPGKPKQL